MFARWASLMAAMLMLVGAACTGSTEGRDDDRVEPTDAAVEEPVSCPDLGPPRMLGRIEADDGELDAAVVGISGLDVSAAGAGERPVAWAVGDRFANEVAGPDTVFLFALDPRDGTLVWRFPLDPDAFEPNPAVAGDPVTSLDLTEEAWPDLEDLAIEFASDRSAARIWLFDTGNNTGNREHLNAYAVDPPDVGDAGRELMPVRYPFALAGQPDYPAVNTEAAIVDTAGGTMAPTAYLIPKFPVDEDHDGSEDDYRVFAFEPAPSAPSDPEGTVQEALRVSFITLDEPGLQVTTAAASQDGTAVAVRAVSGGEEGQPDLDVVALWQREPGTPIAAMFEARPTPDCTWSLNTAKRSASEETLAFDLRTGPAWTGFLWTHDLRDPGAPLFAATRRHR